MYACPPGGLEATMSPSPHPITNARLSLIQCRSFCRSPKNHPFRILEKSISIDFPEVQDRRDATQSMLPIPTSNMFKRRLGILPLQVLFRSPFDWSAERVGWLVVSGVCRKDGIVAKCSAGFAS